MFVEIVFTNDSNSDNFAIAVDLTLLQLNGNFTDRQRYTHESNLFSLYLSLKKSCSENLMGDNRSIPG